MNPKAMLEAIINLNLLLASARRQSASLQEQAVFFLGGATVLLEPFKIDAVMVCQKQGLNLN